MAYSLGSLDRESFLATLTNRVTLTGAQQTALRNEFLNDPAGRGYAGKTNAQALRLLVSDYTIPNPTPRGRAPKVIPNPETRELVRVIRAAGTLTDAQLQDLLTEPDPSYQADLPQPARCEVVLGGLIPELSEVAAARS